MFLFDLHSPRWVGSEDCFSTYDGEFWRAAFCHDLNLVHFQQGLEGQTAVVWNCHFRSLSTSALELKCTFNSCILADHQLQPTSHGKRCIFWGVNPMRNEIQGMVGLNPIELTMWRVFEFLTCQICEAPWSEKGRRQLTLLCQAFTARRARNSNLSLWLWVSSVARGGSFPPWDAS